jgi:hypothetical protein
VPDGGGRGRQPLGDAGVDGLGGPAAVPFRVRLALEGVVDRFDPLPDPADRLVPGASPRRSGRTVLIVGSEVAGSSKPWPAKPLSPMRISPGRSAPVRAACAGSSAAASRSPVFGLAGYHAAGIPSGVVTRYGFSPRYQRECAAQLP